MEKVKQLKNIDKRPKTLFRSKSFRCPFCLFFFKLREEESKVIYREADREVGGIPAGDFFPFTIVVSRSDTQRIIIRETDMQIIKFN